MVLPDSHGIPRAPCYSGTRQGVAPVSRTGLSPATAELSRPFRYPARFVTPCQPGRTGQAVPLPPARNARRLSHATRFSLIPFRSPLLRESLLLSLPAGTEMFHFPALPPAALCIQAEATAHDGCRVSPFGHPRITAWLPAPRGLSQAPTSFIGSWYQGIHRVPLKTWHNKKHYIPSVSQRNRRCSRPLCSSQETDRNQAPAPQPRRPGQPARTKTTALSGCSLRTQQCAHPGPAPRSPVPQPRERGAY